MCVIAAAAYLGLGIARGDAAEGVISMIIMLAYAVLLRVRGPRGEVASLLGGTSEDERQSALMLRASAMTGNTLVLAAVLGMLGTFATGSALAYAFATMAAIGGRTFAGSLAWYSKHA